MARSLYTVLFFTLAVGGVVGCQQNSVVRQLPPPNLDGPVVRQSPPAQSPVARACCAGPRRADVPEGWIPAVPANKWKWIVIHHSATPAGSAASFDRMHRQKGWDELGYHFVIGNGTGSKDGQIEVGSRWPKQKWGAHAKTPNNDYNNYGIGICLVGNFEIDRPTPAQLASLAKLTAYLMRTYHLPVKDVIGHGETKATDCPGRFLSIAQIRRMATQLAQEEGVEFEQPAHASSGELLREVMPR